MLSQLDYVVWKFLKFIVNSASRPFNLVQLYVVKAKSNVCFIFLYNAILYCFCKHEVNSYTLSLYSYLNTKSSGWYPLFGSCLMKMSQVFYSVRVSCFLHVHHIKLWHVSTFSLSQCLSQFFMQSDIQWSLFGPSNTMKKMRILKDTWEN